MRTMLAATLLALMSPALMLAQTVGGTVHQTEAGSEINEGARAYKAGRFDEAQQHFERALKLDPTSKNALFFIARAIHAQY